MPLLTTTAESWEMLADRWMMASRNSSMSSSYCSPRTRLWRSPMYIGSYISSYTPVQLLAFTHDSLQISSWKIFDSQSHCIKTHANRKNFQSDAFRFIRRISEKVPDCIGFGFGIHHIPCTSHRQYSCLLPIHIGWPSSIGLDSLG